MQYLRPALVLLSLVLPLAAQTRQITVAASSGFQRAADALAQKFEQQSGIKVAFVFGASGKLAQDIQNGTSRVDGFISADDKYVRDLVRGRKADVRSARVFAHGRLAAYSTGNKVKKIADLNDAAITRVAYADADVDPFGQAARQVIYNKEMFRALKSKLIVAPSADEARMMVDQGKADAALVAWASVKGQGGVLIDFALHRPLRFTIAATSSSPNGAQVEMFTKFLFDPASVAYLEDLGFDKPTVSGSPYKTAP